MSNIAAALGLEHHHPIMSKLYGHGYKTNRQTYRQTTSFDKNFDHLSMNNRFEAAKFEPDPTFEKTINEIKSNHLKSITSVDINISSITSNKPPHV